MTTQELIDRVKLRLDDKIAPRVFKDLDVLIALNDAQSEFALRTLCIFDGTANVSITAQSPWVQLPTDTCWVIAAWTDLSTPLTLVTQHELDFGYFEINGTEAAVRKSNWRSTQGSPMYLVTDLGPQQVRLVPRPVVGGTLFVERYRLPVAMSTTVMPEIPAAYQSDLIIGALAYLFDVPDTEVYDKEASLLKRREWENRLQIAEQLLQTALRVPMRVIPPTTGTGFMQPVGNTNGVAPNVNTNN